ncbi:hypothetical protein N7501_008963 [Penicillium viridicatum]|nr:hypothetical protein N7501_008963 [Penicillium viridicatum]
MPSLANVPNAWKRWCGRLHKLSESPDINTTRLQEFIKKPPLEPEIATISAADMTPTDVNNLFGLSELRGQENWHLPRRLILLRPDFDTWIDTFTEFTRSSKPTEAQTRCKIDALLFTVYESLKADGLLDYGPKITLQFETSLEWGPINYQKKEHKCVGRADYTMFFGERDHMACHLVVLEAKKDTTGTDLGQLLAYMAMVRASRKARGQSDSTVWGALTDGQWFYFVRLDNEGQWSVVAYRANHGWGEIANMMAYMVLQGHKIAESPLRSSCSSNPSTRHSVLSSKAPRIPSITIQEAIEENTDLFPASAFG